MSSMIQGGLGTLKDMANPFFRLVNSATTDDGSHNVAYYQMEEIKEGAFQSDYGCDSIFKATLQRLETRSAVTVAKSLHIIRILMMEGPASFLPKVGMASGKFLQIASNSSPDIRRGSLEDKNRELAQAIHQAIAGDSKALARFSAENSHGPGMTAPSSSNSSSNHAGAAGNKPQSYKSEFLQQQEKEQRNHKKRLEEEQRNKTTLVVNERLLESFDGSLPPAKLVDSAIQNPKKKFTSEELSAFVDATLQTEKPQEVCNALDLILRDGKQSLQNRYKALTIVEAIVGSGQVPEGVIFFKSHSLGVQRHLTIERLDNPAKAEASKAVAQSILTLVLNSTPSTAASRQRSGSNVGPTASSSSASTAAAAPSSSAWTWNGPNQPPPPSNQKIASMDNLFCSLSVKNQPTHAAPKPTMAPPPQQQQQFVDPWGPSNSWGAAPLPAQTAAPPPTVAAAPLSHSNSFFHSTTTAPSPALNASIVYPPTPNNSFSSFPSEGGGSSLNSTLLAQQVGALLMEQQQQQQQQQPATPQAPPPPSNNDVAAQMEQFQRNMMLMMQMVQQQQQQQQPPPQQQQSVPQPSVLPPPVAPLLPPPQPLQQEARSVSVHSDRSESANHRLTTMDESSPPQPPQPAEIIAAAPAAVSSPVAIRSESSPLPPPPPAPAPPAAVVGPSAEAAATMALMQQLEKQMEATRNMLIQQQAAYVALQNQLQRQLMGQ